MKDDRVYLNQIADAIAKVELFTAGMSAAQFAADAKTQSAVLLQLMLIGEVSKKVSVKTKSAVVLPWREIAGFRDRAIHDYFEIDLEIVWHTVQKDIPELKGALQSFFSH